MIPDYTINDAHRDGFECGLLYILRYATEVEDIDIRNSLISRLTEHLAEKKPWKSREEWEWLIRGSLERWNRK